VVSSLISKYDEKDKITAIGLWGPQQRSGCETLLFMQSIKYITMRKNLKLTDAPGEPDEPGYSEKVDNTLFNKKLSEGFNLDAVGD